MPIRLPHFSQWDGQIQKDVALGPVRLGVIASVFNILNTEIATARNGSVGSTDLTNPDNPQFKTTSTISGRAASSSACGWSSERMALNGSQATAGKPGFELTLDCSIRCI